MTAKVSRRAFLRRATLIEDPGVRRPPGADPNRFADLCRDCDICLHECPEDVLALDESGRPFFDPARGECTFCSACAEACPSGALAVSRIPDWPWRAQASGSCLSLNGVACRTCQDNCDTGAIRFRLMTGGRASATIDHEPCSGCGACVSTCPVGAIELVRDYQNTREDVA